MRNITTLDKRQKKLLDKIIKLSNELEKHKKRGKLQWAWIPEELVPLFVKLGLISGKAFDDEPVCTVTSFGELTEETKKMIREN